MKKNKINALLILLMMGSFSIRTTAQGVGDYPRDCCDSGAIIDYAKLLSLDKKRVMTPSRVINNDIKEMQITLLNLDSIISLKSYFTNYLFIKVYDASGDNFYTKDSTINTAILHPFIRPAKVMVYDKINYRYYKIIGYDHSDLLLFSQSKGGIDKHLFRYLISTINNQFDMDCDWKLHYNKYIKRKWTYRNKTPKEMEDPFFISLRKREEMIFLEGVD
jgi:hypothetical protein